MVIHKQSPQTAASIPSDDHEESQRVYEKGLQHLEARRWAEAARCSQEALLLRLDFPEAEELLNDAQRGQKAQLAYDLGLRFTEQARWEEGIARLEEANASGIEFPDLPAKLEFARRQREMEDLHQKALQHEKAGQWVEAVATLKNLCELDENYKQADERLARAERQLGMKRMSEQVTVWLSDRVLHSATHVAARSQRRIEDVLADWLDRVVTELPVDELPDQEVLALAELQLAPEQQAVLSELLIQNREGALNAEGRRQLDEMMRIYEHGLLRKAQALRVAVQRGLREPLQP
jgi:tetratricopeptide (TPR) repeat protein